MLEPNTWGNEIMLKGNDYQPKKLLIVKQILLVSTLGNVQNSMENMHTDARVLGIDTKKLILL